MADVTSVASLMIDSVATKIEKLILIGKHCIVAEVTINANTSRSICAAVYLLEFFVVENFLIFHNDFSFALLPLHLFIRCRWESGYNFFEKLFSYPIFTIRSCSSYRAALC